jgi:hypothetical protein
LEKQSSQGNGGWKKDVFHEMQEVNKKSPAKKKDA